MTGWPTTARTLVSVSLHTWLPPSPTPPPLLSCLGASLLKAEEYKAPRAMLVWSSLVPSPSPLPVFELWQGGVDFFLAFLTSSFCMNYAGMVYPCHGLARCQFCKTSSQNAEASRGRGVWGNLPHKIQSLLNVTHGTIPSVFWLCRTSSPESLQAFVT